MDSPFDQMQHAKTTRYAAECATRLIEQVDVVALSDEELKLLCVEAHLLFTTLENFKIFASREIADRGL